MIAPWPDVKIATMHIGIYIYIYIYIYKCFWSRPGGLQGFPALRASQAFVTTGVLKTFKTLLFTAREPLGPPRALFCAPKAPFCAPRALFCAPRVRDLRGILKMLYKIRPIPPPPAPISPPIISQYRYKPGIGLPRIAIFHLGDLPKCRYEPGIGLPIMATSSSWNLPKMLIMAIYQS